MTRTMTRRRAAPPVERPDPVARARLWLLLGVLVAVPLAFDAEHNDAFSTVKLAAYAAGVGALLAALAVHWAASGHLPRWRSPLHLAAGGVLLWAVVATVASVNPTYSVLGRYGAYDGLVSVLLGVGLFVAVADTVTPASLRRVLSVVYFGAGGPVVLYGLLQLHDSLVGSGARWDVVQWKWFEFRDSWIWSTFGNPNHLAAFLVVLIPLGVVLAVVHTDGRVRGLAVAQLVAVLAELLYAGARGAWLGAAAGVVLLAVLLARDVRARWGLARPVAGAVAAVGLLGALSTVSGLTPNLWRDLTSIVDPEGRTTIERTEIWRTAWRMGTDRPLVGVGPDMYEVVFHRYETRRYVEEFGPEASPNGPHNVFLTHLAAGGFPALGAFVALLGVAGWQARRSLRRLAAEEEAQRQAVARSRVRDQRLLLSGTVAALGGFVVQATFNAQMIDLTFWMWVLLGVVAASRVAPDGARDGPSPARAVAVPVAVVAIAAALVVAWQGARPYRADGAVTEAQARAGFVLALARDGQLDRARGEATLASRRYADAAALNPWEADFPAGHASFQLQLGRIELEASDSSLRAEAIERLRTARALQREAVRLRPEDAVLLRDYAAMLTEITRLAGPALDHSAEAARVRASVREANPWAQVPAGTGTRARPNERTQRAATIPTRATAPPTR